MDEGFHHCGRHLQRTPKGEIKCGQKQYTASIEKIPVNNMRRNQKDSKITAEERQLLHSGNGQIQWLVKSTRMDLAFQLAEPQARAHDEGATVQDLLDFNKMVSDAKTDEVTITFKKIDLSEAVIVAIGDSSFANVGKSKTASQAGLIVLLADNTGNKFLQGEASRVSALIWRSHRIKRVVRSTLTAETMAALEAVESGDLIRGHLAELHGGLEYKSHAVDVPRNFKMVHVTDCKSLYDLLQKRGTIPSERRLLIDIEALRNDIDENNMVSKWINTRQMLADCLTKGDRRAADYLRYVLRTGLYRLTEDPQADQAIAESRYSLKGARGEYYRAKYPKRRRPSEQAYVHEGFTYYNDAIAEVRYGAKAARNPPKRACR